MRTVQQILAAKASSEMVSITPDRSTYEALQLMAEKDIGAVAVMAGGVYLGLMTEREYARQIVLKGRASRNTPVGELMQTGIPTVGPGQTIEECMSIMTERRTRYLPVFEGERLAGLISIGDVVKNLLTEYRSQVDNLNRYITGGDFGG